MGRFYLQVALAASLAGLVPMAKAAEASSPAGAATTPAQNVPANTRRTNAATDSDVLLNLFQKKGLITDQEAQEARAALATHRGEAVVASKTYSALPEWITGIKFSGDFRGRFEENNAQDSAYFNRDRYRYRVRAGATVTMENHFDVGLRLASGNPQLNPGGALVGGQPITANQDLNSLESRKFIWIDTAYAKWTPVNNDAWTVSGTIGKMDNPFNLSNMIWDYDIDPEGLALQAAYKINHNHALKLNGAYFVLDELNQGVGTVPSINPGHDPYVYGAQVLWESKWTPKFETSLGLAAFNIVNRDSLSAKIQPYYNSGNSRDAGTFALLYNYNPIIATAFATYKFDSVPLYAGKFPIKASLEYMNNPGAPSNNEAYRLGAVLGKAGKKSLWEVSYRYQRLEADAWMDALVDDDNGAYYASGHPQLAGTGKANGWFGGTNVKGHLLQATYSFTDFLNFTFTYYLNDLIIAAPGKDSSAGHFMVDLMWKF